MLDEAGLARLDERVYRELHEVHEGRRLTYADEGYTRSGLRPAEQHLVQRNFPAGARVLVTGAGGGREVLALLDAGYDAHGLEPNPWLAAAGNRTLEELGHGRRLAAMPRSAMPPRGTAAAYDALVVGWTSYTLMPGRGRRTAFLRAARDHLTAAAPVLLSTWVRDDDDPHVARVARVGSAIRSLRRAPPLELGDALAPNFVHRFTGAELGAELADAGLVAVDQVLDEHLWVLARATALSGTPPPAG